MIVLEKNRAASIHEKKFTLVKIERRLHMGRWICIDEMLYFYGLVSSLLVTSQIEDLVCWDHSLAVACIKTWSKERRIINEPRHDISNNVLF